MKHSGNFTEAKQVFYALNPQNVEMSVSASFICSSLFLSLSLSLGFEGVCSGIANQRRI